MTKLISIIVVMNIVLLTTISYGASSRCTVEQVDGSRLIIDCGEKASNFKTEDKIKIKSAKKKNVEDKKNGTDN